jgi:hypothetical protein
MGQDVVEVEVGSVVGHKQGTDIKDSITHSGWGQLVGVVGGQVGAEVNLVTVGQVIAFVGAIVERRRLDLLASGVMGVLSGDREGKSTL